jgi:hypothetical protein
MMKPLPIMLAVFLPTAVLGAEPPPLQNNPFSRPPAPVIREEVRPEGDARDTPLIVIATVVSNKAAFANIEGKVLRPGQEINGYLLKRVYEDRAVFERNGDELTVYVKPELDENDEEATQNKRRR